LAGRVIASTAAIAVVYLGGGYWAIIVNSSLSNAAATFISYILGPYRPKFSLSRFSDFSSFLGWFSTAQIFKAVSWQFDRILLGYFITKSDLGQYTTASDLAIFPMQSLIGPAMQPLMAAFARISDDRKRLRSAYLKASNLTMMLAAPTCFGISLTSDLLVNLLLGPKWTETGLYLQWLSLSIVLSVFYQPMHSLALATRRTDLVFRLSVIEACSRILLVLAGLYLYSLMGVIISRLGMSLIMFVVSMFFARWMIGAKLSSQIVNLWKVAVASAIMVLLVLVLRHELDGRGISSTVQLLLIAVSGAAAYIGTLSALGFRFRQYLVGLGVPG
jgi:PST family polysaccharide transporter